VDASVAAVIVEPVQGEGGVRIPPAGFLPALRERCTRAGALLVFDEVLTGFGRTGRRFAGEHWGVVPDLLVLGKALGGGYPLGAFAGSSEVLHTLTHDPPLAHVTTFGGHPVSCAAGRAALGVMLSEDLPGRAARLGAWFLEALRERMGSRPEVVEVRGLGMLLAIEFRNAAATAAFVRTCRERGLLVGWTLHHDHIVRLAPPLVTPEDALAEAAATMGEALESLA
jgi:acetylornithine/succinyldiaminopimelate/putrescine aminotransferase